MKKRKNPAGLAAMGLAAALALLLLVGQLPAKADAASSGEIQNQINQMQAQQEQLQAQIQELENKRTENLSEIQKIVEQKTITETQIVLLNEQISGMQEQLAAYRVLIADEQEKLDAAEEKLALLHEAYKTRIRAMEENGEMSVWLILFRANGLADFLDRINMIQEIAAADRKRLEEIAEAKDLVEEKKQALLEQNTEAQKVKQEQEETKRLLDEKSKEADSLLGLLMEQEEEFEALLQESEDRQNSLLDELAQKEKEYLEAKEEEEYQQWLSTSVPNDVLPNHQAPGGNYDDSGIYWVIPTKYIRVSSKFQSDRLHPILGYVRPHKGIDLAANTGTPVYATRSGTVTTASTGAENGNYVVINHGDGYSSAYLHMHYYIVKPGQYVQAGEQIGVVGNTGLSKGSHLHFSIIHDGEYVDPADYVEFY